METKENTHAPVTGVLGTVLGGSAVGLTALQWLKDAFGSKANNSSPGWNCLVQALGPVVGEMLRSGSGSNGCGEHEAAILRSRIAALEAEGFAEKVGINTFKEAKAMVDDLAARTSANFKEVFTEQVNNRVEIAVLKKELECKDKIDDLRLQLSEAKTGAKIAEVANAAACGIDTANAGIARLQATVASITETVIPASAICKRNGGNGCNNCPQQ